MSNPLYQTYAQASAGRNGAVTVEENTLTLNLSYPKALGGDGSGNNPEQLFAAGYSACFSNAVLHAAKMQKVDLKQAPVKAMVAMKSNSEGGFVLEVSLEVTLELEDSQANEVVTLAHKVCPYSNATRNNIAVDITVNGNALHS